MMHIAAQAYPLDFYALIAAAFAAIVQVQIFVTFF